jgi:molybdopterin-binding protein
MMIFLRIDKKCWTFTMLYIIFQRLHISITFRKGTNMKYGARNQLVGKVTEIKKGTLMCKVKLDVDPGATMSSVMTIESLDDLGIKKGDKVKIVVKAINVLLVKE